MQNYKKVPNILTHFKIFWHICSFFCNWVFIVCLSWVNIVIKCRRNDVFAKRWGRATTPIVFCVMR